MCVWLAGVLLLESLLFLSFVALPSLDPILAVSAHSCWFNIGLAAEWQAVTNMVTIILWLRCCVLSEQQAVLLTHLAASRPFTIQGPFSLLNHDAKAKAPSRPLHGRQVLTGGHFFIDHASVEAACAHRSRFTWSGWDACCCGSPLNHIGMLLQALTTSPHPPTNWWKLSAAFVQRWVGSAEARNPLKGFAPAAVSWSVTTCSVSFQRLYPVSYLVHLWRVNKFVVLSHQLWNGPAPSRSWNPWNANPNSWLSCAEVMDHSTDPI